MRRTIFRTEVTSSNATGWLGEVRIASPITHTVWAIGSLVCGISIGLWLYFGEYTRRERVQGLVVPVGGLAKVRSRSAGDVSKVMVVEGDLVKRGDPLIVVDSERYLDSIVGVSEGVSGTLREQQSTLQRDLDTTRSIASREQEDLRRQVILVREQIQHNRDEVDIQRADAREQAALLQRVESLLEKGYISVSDVQRQRTSASMSSAAVVRQLATRAALEQQLRDVEGRLARIPLTMASQLNESSRQLARTAAELGRNEVERTSVIRAPIDGIVSSLHVSSGQTVITGQSVAAIVPRGARMEADLLVASAAVGFIRPGNRVAIHYRAYPFQKFGVHQGTVRSRSSSAMSPVEINEAFGLPGVVEPLYRVRVELPAQTIRTYEEEKALMAGMAVDADILLDRRRMYEWLFEPIYTMRKKLEEAP